MERDIRIRRLFNISSRVPSEGASPTRPPPRSLSRERRFIHRAPFIHLSKSRLDEPSSRFPKRVPYGKRCLSPDPFPHILQSLQQRSPPSRFPSQRFHRERHSTTKAPFNHISKSLVDEPTPAWKVAFVTVIHFVCIVALYFSTPADNRRLVK